MYLAQKVNRPELLGKEEDKVDYAAISGVMKDIWSSVIKIVFGGEEYVKIGQEQLKKIQELYNKLETYLANHNRTDTFLGYESYLDIEALF